MKKVWVGLLGMIIVILPSCAEKKTAKENVTTVKTTVVESYGQELSLTFPGKVKAASDVNLAFRVSGTLLNVPVDAGVYVRKGQLLAEIDPRDYEIQLSATEAEYKQVKSEAERIIALYEKQSVPPNDYDKAVFGLQQITAKYNAHKNALADTRLYAPYEGYVQKRYFDANETIGAGISVISMINTGSPEVEINIPSSEYIRRDLYDSFYCSVDIYPDVTFPMELIAVTQKANLNQLYTMRLRLKPVAGQRFPTPGMSTMVTIHYKEKESTLTAIPAPALFEYKGNSAVWIYNPQSQTVTVREVKPLEIRTNGTIIISDGLKPEEIVVSAGVHSLEEGQIVERIPAVSTTNIGGLL